MTRKLQFVRYRYAIVLFLVLSTVLMLSGCGEISTTIFPAPIATGPVCTPEAPLENIYQVTPQQPWVNLIFEFAFPTLPTPIPPATPVPLDEQKILRSRYAALQQLIQETTRWSDAKTIKFDDASQAQITVTYLSPELIQAVFLNQVLQDRLLISDFYTQLENALNGVAKRDELLFLLTVTTINNNQNPTRHTIKIPIQEMVLLNAENLTIVHSHNDRNLEQVIDASLEPVFGYLGYPISVATAEQCDWVLDPKYNTNIVITLPFLEMNGIDNKTSYFWTIPYAPLITPALPSATATFDIPEGFDPNLLTPLSVPPSDINQASYWRDFARFIWGQITLGKY